MSSTPATRPAPARSGLRRLIGQSPGRQRPQQPPPPRVRPGSGPAGPGRPGGRGRWIRMLWPFALVLAVQLVFALGSMTSSTAYSYSAFVSAVDAGKVASVTLDSAGAVTGKLTSGGSFTSQLPTALNDTSLAGDLQAHHVVVTAASAGFPWLTLFLLFGPFLLLGGVLVWSGRRAAKGMSGITSFGRSRAKIFDAERPTTRFTDVAGYAGVKREIGEVVDYLRDPVPYQAVGAKGPQGVLLVGPPGTGKTLLARAVAGEAEVTFLSVSGPEFVEMFVGVGASRVRDLFAQARKRAPAIIFIDELDSIGARRSAGLMGGNDEREQTVNQLLTELDGFEQSPGVVVIAATNRPESLDPALLRPGRFDRQVTVPLPTMSEREAILAVHGRGKPLAADVDLGVVARATPGFSGADLANLLNEAAIGTVRGGRASVTALDLDTAKDRILIGRREDSTVLLPEEKYAVAVHEAGHALVAAASPGADPVVKVTILPAGSALGVTQQLPEVERRLYGQARLEASLAVRMGGRAAELLVLGEGSTGAANDLAGATDLATRMVREFGLSDELGPVGYAESSPGYLGGPDLSARPYSEATQRIIDAEVSRILRESARRAVDLLTRHRGALDRLTSLLVERETVDGETVLTCLHQDVAGPSVPVG